MLNAYKLFTRSTAVYPDAQKGTAQALAYTALGLSGEAGEVANKVKKLLRDSDTPEQRREIGSEAGDLIWYWVRLCDELGLDPESVIQENIAKLESRKVRGVLKGSGDHR